MAIIKNIQGPIFWEILILIIIVAIQLFHIDFDFIVSKYNGTQYYFSTPKWADWQLGENKEKWYSCVQDVICSKLSTNECYIVVDYKNGDSFTRSILVNSMSDAKLSIADLLKPQNESFTLQNSANWGLNHYKLHKPYLRAMAIAPFITGTITKEKSPDILLIGVAGATLNNFFLEMPNKPYVTGVELDPKMIELATKWFDLRPSFRHKILIEDGVNFFTNRHYEDEKFDAIYIDACQTDHDDDLNCPIFKFRTEELASHMQKSLRKNGTLAINLLSLNNNISAYDMVLEVYEKYFSICFFLNAQNGDWTNRVLVCTNADIIVDQNEFTKKLDQNMPKKFLEYNDFSIKIVNS